jgi:probable F420-dependent oxidoreductase
VEFWQSLSFTETEQLVDLAKLCEEVGFHGALLSDHVFFPDRLDSRYPYAEDGAPPFGPETEWPEPWAAISAMASATTRLRFTTAVYLAALRHPLLVAQSVATAAVLSRDRVALGVGVGWMAEEFAVLGRDFHTRGRRLDETIQVLRAVWAGGMTEHHGAHYDFDRLQMSPVPRRRIPIYVGGTSPAALRRAARNDGWIGAGNDPAELPGLLRRLRAHRREVGRDAEPFETIVAVNAPPDVDLFRRLEDAGATATIHYPLVFALGPGASLERKRRALERFGDAVLARCAGTRGAARRGSG